MKLDLIKLHSTGFNTKFPPEWMQVKQTQSSTFRNKLPNLHAHGKLWIPVTMIPHLTRSTQPLTNLSYSFHSNFKQADDVSPLTSRNKSNPMVICVVVQTRREIFFNLSHLKSQGIVN